MTILRLLPVILAAPVLAAHLMRAGWPLPLVVAVALSPLLLLVRRRWAARGLQLLLAAGALEWARTGVLLILARRAAGAPHLRLLAILAAVTLVTALAAWAAGRVAGGRTRAALAEAAR